MKLKEYFIPTNLEEIKNIRNKCKDNFLYISGGTEINSQKNINVDYLIDISKLGLKGIEKKDNNIIIGANVTIQEIIENTTIKDNKLLALIKACKNIVNLNIRNMATIGGNIGSNKSSSDLIPVLIAYSSKLEIENGKIIEVEEYIKNEMRDLILNIIIPIPNLDEFNIDIRRFTRSSNDLAIINIAFSFINKDNKINSPKVVIGGIDKHVKRVKEIEKYLENKKLVDIKEEDIKDVIEKNISPITDIRGTSEFKKELVKGLLIDLIESFKK